METLASTLEGIGKRSLETYMVFCQHCNKLQSILRRIQLELELPLILYLLKRTHRA